MARTKLFQALFAILLAGTSMVWLSGCNTIEGIGDDVEAAGEGISGTADETNPYKDKE